MKKHKNVATIFSKFFLILLILIFGFMISAEAKTNSAKPVIVVLDAGHGGRDSGAVGNGLQEKEMTLSIILSAKKYFDQDRRFKVYYTRTTDKTVSLKSRYSLANKKNADLYISIHINSYSSSSEGTSTLYNGKRNSKTKKNGHTNKSLAKAMQKTFASVTGFPNRGIVDRSDLITIGHTKMPSCMIEVGFISNKSEAKKMKKNLKSYGKTLYQAIVKYCY